MYKVNCKYCGELQFRHRISKKGVSCQECLRKIQYEKLKTTSRKLSQRSKTISGEADEFERFEESIIRDMANK